MLSEKDLQIWIFFCCSASHFAHTSCKFLANILGIWELFKFYIFVIVVWTLQYLLHHLVSTNILIGRGYATFVP